MHPAPAPADTLSGDRQCDGSCAAARSESDEGPECSCADERAAWSDE